MTAIRLRTTAAALLKRCLSALAVSHPAAFLVAALQASSPPLAHAQAAPPAVLGTWRITRVLPTHRSTCWDQARARTLLGTTLTYQAHALVWSGGREAVSDTFARTLTAQQFLQESTVDLKDLGIASASVVELDLQHEDEDVTGATTEVPGDTVLLAGPARIVVSACGVYYSAVRAARQGPAK